MKLAARPRLMTIPLVKIESGSENGRVTGRICLGGADEEEVQMIEKCIALREGQGTVCWRPA